MGAGESVTETGIDVVARRRMAQVCKHVEPGSDAVGLGIDEDAVTVEHDGDGTGHPAARSRMSSETRFGSALPAVAFITCPTRKPMTF